MEVSGKFFAFSVQTVLLNGLHFVSFLWPLTRSTASRTHIPLPSFSWGHKHPPLRLEHPQARAGRAPALPTPTLHKASRRLTHLHWQSTRAPRYVRTAFSAATHADAFFTRGHSRAAPNKRHRPGHREAQSGGSRKPRSKATRPARAPETSGSGRAARVCASAEHRPAGGGDLR